MSENITETPTFVRGSCAPEEEESLDTINNRLDPLTSRIRKKILYQNLNCLVVIVGQTGLGKSYSGIGLAGKIDPTFYSNISTRVVFTIRQLKELLNSGQLSKGNSILFDECGVDYGSRKWQTYQNIAMGEILQTMRYRNLCVIMTVPSLEFVDIVARRLMHYYIECVGVDYKRNLNLYRPFRCELKPRLSKVFFYSIHYKGYDKITATLELVKQEKPPEFVCEIYEKLAQDYKDSVIARKASREEQKKEQYDDLIAKIKIKPEEYMKESHNRKIYSVELLGAKLGLSETKAKRLRALLEKELPIEQAEIAGQEEKDIVKRYSFSEG